MKRRRRQQEGTGIPPLWDPWKKRGQKESGDYLELLADEGARVSGLLQNPANWPGLQNEAAGLAHAYGVFGMLGPCGVIDPADYAGLFRGPAPDFRLPEPPEPASRTSRTLSDELIAIAPLDAAEARLSMRQRWIRMGRRMIAAAN